MRLKEEQMHPLWLLGAATIIFGGAIAGIFFTKTAGFGKYTTSALVMTLVLYVAALAYVTDKVEWEPMSNLLFAAVGFAGGLIAAKTDAR